jgi:hypothetical protein
MFSNNPLFIEKLVQTRQEDILRELPDPSIYEFQKTNRFSPQLRANARIWMPIGVLLALVWWIHVLI